MREVIAWLALILLATVGAAAYHFAGILLECVLAQARRLLHRLRYRRRPLRK